MKMMIAKCCGEIVIPSGSRRNAKFCLCHKSAVWWDDPNTGELAVWRINDFSPMPEVLGINNAFLAAPMSRLGMVDKPTLHATCEAAEGYLFRDLDSPIVRVSPTSKVIRGIRLATDDDLESVLMISNPKMEN